MYPVRGKGSGEIGDIPWVSRHFCRVTAPLVCTSSYLQITCSANRVLHLRGACAVAGTQCSLVASPSMHIERGVGDETTT